MPTEPETLRARSTKVELTFRNGLCYLFGIQILWWLLYPARVTARRVIGHFFGVHVGAWVYRSVLTPANGLSAASLVFFCYSLSSYLQGAIPLAAHISHLCLIVITDFFDGPLARNNNEVTVLGTYLDHGRDWTVMTWVLVLSFQQNIFPKEFIAVALSVIPLLFTVNIVNFKRCYVPDAGFLKNLSTFAEDELQTDWVGRVQFVILTIGLFGGLFLSVESQPGFLFQWIFRYIEPETTAMLVRLALAIFILIGGISISEARTYPESRIKRFREKLRQMKYGSL